MNESRFKEICIADGQRPEDWIASFDKKNLDIEIDGMFFVHYASQFSLQTLKCILEIDLQQLNKKDGDDQTPLYAAISRHQVESIQGIIELDRAQLYSKNAFNEDYIAVIATSHSKEMADLLDWSLSKDISLIWRIPQQMYGTEYEPSKVKWHTDDPDIQAVLAKHRANIDFLIKGSIKSEYNSVLYKCTSLLGKPLPKVLLDLINDMAEHKGLPQINTGSTVIGESTEGDVFESSRGLSTQLCKFIDKPLTIDLNSIIKFYQKMRHSFIPISNR